jgi:hypothetical protein
MIIYVKRQRVYVELAELHARHIPSPTGRGKRKTAKVVSDNKTGLF